VSVFSWAVLEGCGRLISGRSELHATDLTITEQLPAD
jgi:hypothetical protein